MPELHVVAEHVDVQQLPHIPGRRKGTRRVSVAPTARRPLLSAHFLRSYGDSLSDLNLVRMFASSTFTRFFSSSLFAQFLMSRMKFSSPRGVDAMPAA